MVQFGALVKLPFQMISRLAAWTRDTFMGVGARPMYEQLHEAWRQHEAWFQNKDWEKLTYGVTYKLVLGPASPTNGEPISCIYIKNQTDEVIERIELVVALVEPVQLEDLGQVGCQDVVVAPRLEPQAVRCLALRNIPFGARMGGLILQENGIRVSVLKDSRFIAEPDRCAQ